MRFSGKVVDGEGKMRMVMRGLPLGSIKWNRR